MDYSKNLDLKSIEYFCEFDKVWKTEQWKDVVGYEGIYQVSDLGRVKSFGNNKTRKEKILKSHNKKGYKYLGISKNGVTKPNSIHRLVLESFVPNP